MKVIDKTYRELLDLKSRRQGWYYTWLIELNITGPMEGSYTQKSIRTGKITAQGNIIY